MSETLIIILAEHNVPINFADHSTKLVSNKLVFPDSVFLCACSVRTLLAKTRSTVRVGRILSFTFIGQRMCPCL